MLTRNLTVIKEIKISRLDMRGATDSSPPQNSRAPWIGIRELRLVFEVPKAIMEAALTPYFEILDLEVTAPKFPGGKWLGVEHNAIKTRGKLSL
jgi:hypothetical protein